MVVHPWSCPWLTNRVPGLARGPQHSAGSLVSLPSSPSSPSSPRSPAQPGNGDTGVSPRFRETTHDTTGASPRTTAASPRRMTIGTNYGTRRYQATHHSILRSLLRQPAQQEAEHDSPANQSYVLTFAVAAIPPQHRNVRVLEPVNPSRCFLFAGLVLSHQAWLSYTLTPQEGFKVCSSPQIPTTQRTEPLGHKGLPRCCEDGQRTSRRRQPSDGLDARGVERC